MSKLTLKKAERKKAKLKIGLQGPSGSGKTYSALLLAKGLVCDWSKIAVIDTENGSADLYSHLGEYNTLTLTAPYTPNRYIEAIKMCVQSGMEVVIIDSITHEWSGKGGCLEIHEKLGGKFQDWAKVTPLHRAFIDEILLSDVHVITTVRTKQDYAMVQENGKAKVEKVGTKEMTREGFEYELTISFSINQNHLATTSKDRTGLFVDESAFTIDESTGQKIKEWADSGKEDVKVEEFKDEKEKVALVKKEEPFINTSIGAKLSRVFFVQAKKIGMQAMEAKKYAKDMFDLESYTEITKEQLTTLLKNVEEVRENEDK